jgi:beta-xylosidase
MLRPHFSFYITFLFVASVSIAQEAVSKVWVADNGDGTYRNPVINADYSDPDAIRVGDDYYMISSSFSHMPGLPILHSKDLVNWSLIGYALNRQPPYDHFNKVQHGGGV